MYVVLCIGYLCCVVVGGVGISFNVSHTRLCFATAHLAAHQDKTERRNADVQEIFRGTHVSFKYRINRTSNNAIQTASIICIYSYIIYITIYIT